MVLVRSVIGILGLSTSGFILSGCGKSEGPKKFNSTPPPDDTTTFTTTEEPDPPPSPPTPSPPPSPPTPTPPSPQPPSPTPYVPPAKNCSACGDLGENNCYHPNWNYTSRIWCSKEPNRQQCELEDNHTAIWCLNDTMDMV